METAVQPQAQTSRVTHDRADVVIIGGGITGLISAYLLSKSGKSVCLFEKRNKLGHGATEYTTAFITQAIDTSYTDLVNIFGAEKTKKIIESHGKAIDLIERIIAEEKIECGFVRCSNYVYANNEKEAEGIREETEVGVRLGLDATFNPEDNHLGFVNRGYMEIKNQAKFDIMAFIEGISNAVRKLGVEILLEEQVREIFRGDLYSIVSSENRDVEAMWVIVATYEPFNKPLALYFKKAFYTTYVFEVKIPKGIIPEGMYEDTRDPYYYFRIDTQDPKDDVLVIGGEDHRSDIPVDEEKNFAALEEHLKKILPNVSFRITHRWTGPILEPVDGLPFIGSHDTHNILYAMAFSGNGMTYSAIAAMIFDDVINGRKNDWDEVYSAHRIPSLKALAVKGKDYGKELIFGAVKNAIVQGKRRKGEKE